MSNFRVEQVVSLMRRAAMSTTYKPALLKALVRVARHEPSLEMPLPRLGREYAKMYWNQTVIYHLRQAAVLSKESEVVKLIRRSAELHKARNYSHLAESGRATIEAAMAKVLTINVLERFHASKPIGMPPLYGWSKGDGAIVLSEASLQFLQEHGPTLEIVANYYWAEYLEACNRLAPRIIQKVSRDGAQRGTLTQYLRILLAEDGGSCFYCEQPLVGTSRAVVDHVIPWSFLLEDSLWDLAAACAPCNGAKSDWLPHRDYIDRLVQRNATLGRSHLRGKVSLLIPGDEIYRLYEAAVSLEWPGFWSPNGAVLS